MPEIAVAADIPGSVWEIAVVLGSRVAEGEQMSKGQTALISEG